MVYRSGGSLRIADRGNWLHSVTRLRFRLLPLHAGLLVRRTRPAMQRQGHVVSWAVFDDTVIGAAGSGAGAVAAQLLCWPQQPGQLSPRQFAGRDGYTAPKARTTAPSSPGRADTAES
jgi:hypothetical protein